MEGKPHSTAAAKALKRLTTCKVVVRKKKKKGVRLTYNGCDSSTSLMNNLNDLAEIVLDNKADYVADDVFMTKLKKFKKGFVTKRSKSDDVEALYHKKQRFIDAKTEDEIKPSKKLIEKAELFIAIHRSQIVNLLQQLSE